MRFNVGAALAVFCLGTAIAMGVSGGAASEDQSGEVIGAVVKSTARDGVVGPSEDGPASSDLRLDLAAIKRTLPANPKNGGLFQAKSWYAPPPAPAVAAHSIPAAPPTPTAPNLPFTYIGRMIDGANAVLFLYKNGQQYTVKAGDTVDGAYRIDKITETEAELTYLPMNVQQHLVLGTPRPGAPLAGAANLPPAPPVLSASSTAQAVAAPPIPPSANSGTTAFAALPPPKVQQ